MAHSEETKRKIGEANRGPASPARMAAIMKLAEARRNNPDYVPWNKGVPRTPEEKENISKARMGIKVAPFTEEHKRKIAEALTGKKRVGKFGYKHTPENIQKMRERQLGKKYSEEIKQKMREARNNLEFRIRLSCTKRGIDVDEFEGFAYNTKYCHKWNNYLKERVRAYFGDVCFVCGLPAEEHKLGKKIVALDVHHVNYDKKVCCNGRPPLLVPLCRKHHMQANNNRDWWIEWFETILYSPEINGKCFFTHEEYTNEIKKGLKRPVKPSLLNKRVVTLPLDQRLQETTDTDHREHKAD